MNYEQAEEWEGLVKDMDLPMTRKIGLSTSMRWFIANGAVMNSNHHNFSAAMALAKKITRHGCYDDNERYANR